MKASITNNQLTITTESADDQYKLGRIAEKTGACVYAVNDGQRSAQIDVPKVIQILAGLER